MNTTRTAQFPTADDYMAKAAKCRDDEMESWDRCDTDGFLSQWALQQLTHAYRAMAAMARNGWEMETTAVFNLAGDLVSTDSRMGQYGPYWLVRLADGSVDFFNESNAKNDARRVANNAKKGYYVGTVRMAMRPNGSDAVIDDAVPPVIVDNGQ